MSRDRVATAMADALRQRFASCRVPGRGWSAESVADVCAGVAINLLAPPGSGSSVQEDPHG